MSFIINLLGTIEIEESKIYLNLKPRWRRDCRLFPPTNAFVVYLD